MIQSSKAPGRTCARTMLQRKLAVTKPAYRDMSKLATVIALLRRPKGASVANIFNATNLQAHSVQGDISGAIKKESGSKVTWIKSGIVRTYSVVR